MVQATTKVQYHHTQESAQQFQSILTILRAYCLHAFQYFTPEVNYHHTREEVAGDIDLQHVSTNH